MRKIALVFSFITFHLFGQSQNWASKIDERLFVHENSAEKIEFLVELKPKPTLRGTHQFKDKVQKGTYVVQQLQRVAEESQKNIVMHLESENIPFQTFWIANVIWVYADFQWVKTISEYEEVQQISENSTLKWLQPIDFQIATDKNAITTWGLGNMEVPEVWKKGYRGQGVVIGGQDTGIDWQHNALKSSYRGWDGTVADHNYNWHDAIKTYNPIDTVQQNPCGLNVDAPCDDGFHGTHTLGSAVGQSDTLHFGVAPDAKWIGCRNMERGYGSPQTYLECFQWFLAPTDLNNEYPDPSKAPHVIINSWACPEFEGCNPNNIPLLEAAVNHLKMAGIVVVASAGNSGEDCNTIKYPPAFFENSFSVGAIREGGSIAGFSSRGGNGLPYLKPNVTAPGVWVRSAIPNNQYAFASGTSMSGPHVAGLVALLISADPSLSGDVERIEKIIEQTAVPKQSILDCDNYLGSEVPNAIYGHGNVNALNALNYVLENPKSDISGLLEVYPNPANDQVFIKLEGRSGIVALYLFDAKGSQVMFKSWDISGGNKGEWVNLSGYSKGIYFYKVCNEMDCWEGKILKN